MMATLLIVSIFAAAFPKKKACKHVFDEGTVAIAATCQEEGKLVSKCEKCGEKVVTVLPKAGHSWVNQFANINNCYSGCVEIELECEYCGILSYSYTDADLKHHDSDHDGYCDICGVDKFLKGQYEFYSPGTEDTYDIILEEGWYAFNSTEFSFNAKTLVLHTGEIIEPKYCSLYGSDNFYGQEEVVFTHNGESYSIPFRKEHDLYVRKIDEFFYVYLPSRFEAFDDEGNSIGYFYHFSASLSQYDDWFQSKVIFSEGYDF